MATFLGGHQKIFWDLLFTSGSWGSSGRINPIEHTITIVAPWITDISTESSGWPEELAKQACSTRIDLNSLSIVLSALGNMGFNIRLVTLEDGKWLRKTEGRMLDNEIQLMSKMRKIGAKCQIRKNMHFKWLCTPVGIWKGSSNSTANGLFGRLQEQNDVFLSPSEARAYSEQKEIMELGIKYSADYFDGSVEIKDSGISPPHGTPSSEIQNPILQPDDSFPLPIMDDLGELPEFVPSEYLTPGQIDSETNSPVGGEAHLSMLKWVEQCIGRICGIIDFVFTTGLREIDVETKQSWLESISVKTLEGDVILLSESEKEDVPEDIESKTTRSEVFEIKDKFHVLQCCGITVEDGKFAISEGIDARGIDLRPAYIETFVECFSISEKMAEERINKLFSLIFSLVQSTCILANSENLNSDLSTTLSSCVLELRERYLNPLEEFF